MLEYGHLTSTLGTSIDARRLLRNLELLRAVFDRLCRFITT